MSFKILWPQKGFFVMSLLKHNWGFVLADNGY